MWWDGDIPTPSSSGSDGNGASWLTLIIIVLFCVVFFGVGLVLLGREFLGNKPTTPMAPPPSENAP